MYLVVIMNSIYTLAIYRYKNDRIIIIINYRQVYNDQSKSGTLSLSASSSSDEPTVRSVPPVDASPGRLRTVVN